MQRIRLYPTAYFVAMLLFPLLLLRINDSWAFFSTPGWVDARLYEGYFLNLKQLLNVYPAVYYGTRLPWLLLGALVFGFAPPEPATYILRLILFYAAEFSLFAIVRMFWRNDLAAVLAALLMTSNTYFLWAIGWDYVNGIALVLILVTTACLTAAATTQAWRFWLVCAGFAFTSMVSSYVPLLLFAPFQVAGYLVMNHWRRRNPLRESLKWFGFAAAGAVVFFGAVNWWLSGHFLYFLPQIRMAQLVESNPGRWKASNYSWVAGATWLIFPAVAMAIAMILAAFTLFWRPKDASRIELRRGVALASLLLIGIDAVFVVTEIKGFWFLQASYFAAFLIPYSYICIGGALALAATRIGKWRLGIVGGVMAALLLPFLYVPGGALRPCAPSCQLASPVGWLALTGCVLLATSALSRRAWLAALSVVPFSLSNIATADVSEFSFPSSPVARAHFSMIFDAARVLRSYDPEGTLRFWYDRKEPLGGLFQSIGWTFLWGYGRVVSEDFPNRNDNQYTGIPGQISAGDRVAIFSSRNNALPAASDTLAKLGLQYEKLGDADVRGGAEGFHLNFIRLIRKDLGPASEIPLANIQGLQPTAVVREADGSVGVETQSPPWTYAAFVTVPKTGHDGPCSGLVKLNVHVKRGLVGIGVLTTDQKDFVARRFVPVTPDPVDVFLEIPRLDNASEVLIQAWDSGIKSFVDVRSVSIALYNCPAILASKPGSRSAHASN